MDWIFDEGGRLAAGYSGQARDCAVRAIAIAAELDYQEVYDHINELAKSERRGKNKRDISNSRTGVYVQLVHRYLEDELGWTWTPTMQVGQGCRVHMREEELPLGRVIVRLSRHYAAVIDGVLRDTFDCTRDGTRCVYGYWKAPEDDS